MSSTHIDLLCERALKLAEALNHAYCTVGHLLVVAHPSQKELCSDVLAFIIEHTPPLKPRGTLEPTLGFQRVVKRMVEGADLVDAIASEGQDAWGPRFLAEHGLLNGSVWNGVQKER